MKYFTVQKLLLEDVTPGKLPAAVMATAQVSKPDDGSVMLKCEMKLTEAVRSNGPRSHASRRVARSLGLPVSPETPAGPCVPASSNVVPPTVS